MKDVPVWAYIAVIAAITAVLRFLPFAVFRKNVPASVAYLGNVLPCSVIGMLVVYCLRNTDVMSSSHAVPEVIGVICAVVLHKWKHNTLLTVLVSTAVYMLLIRLF